MKILKQELFDTFNGFADKRIKNLDRSSTFIIDDRNEDDVGADGQLYSYFCLVFAEVIDSDTVKVELRGNVPDSEKVRLRINELGGTFQDGHVTFTIARGEEMGLYYLSRAFNAIVASGKRYSVSNYKYVCPRTANSLKKLRLALQRAWRQDAPSTLSPVS